MGNKNTVSYKNQDIKKSNHCDNLDKKLILK